MTEQNHSTPTFSVVIPTFNRGAMVRAAIQSVLAQEYIDYEIIVVDDGSTDATAKTLADYRDRIVFLQQNNRGPGAARNLGAGHARGAYLAFLDSDDLWFPWTLKVFAEAIEKEHRPTIVAGSLHEFRDCKELACVACDELRTQSFRDYFATSGRGIFVGAGMSVIERHTFDHVGGFTERRINAEDHDLMMRLGNAPRFVQIEGPATLAYRRHQGSIREQIGMTYLGTRFLIAQERVGKYPGGPSQRRERRVILTSNIRPVILECLRRGRFHEAIRLYRESFPWHLEQARFRFLLGTPPRAFIELFRPARSRETAAAQ